MTDKNDLEQLKKVFEKFDKKYAKILANESWPSGSKVRTWYSKNPRGITLKIKKIIEYLKWRLFDNGKYTWWGKLDEVVFWNMYTSEGKLTIPDGVTVEADGANYLDFIEAAKSLRKLKERSKPED
jgi:hypothetical protein